MHNKHFELVIFCAAVLSLCPLALAQPEKSQELAKRKEGISVSPKELYRNSLPSIVQVTATAAGGEKAIGTGFFLQGFGLVTAFHVVDGAMAVKCRYADGREFEPAGLVGGDRGLDLAILDAGAQGVEVLAMAGATAETGDKLYVIGSPRGLDFSFSDGLVSSRRNVSGVELIQFSAPASPGNSGGPVLDEKGAVIGVVCWQIERGQNLNFAVSVEQLNKIPKGSVVRWNAVPAPAVVARKTEGFRFFRGHAYNIAELSRRPESAYQLAPVYPDTMRARGHSGEALVTFVIDENGNVPDAYADSATDDAFALSAVYAVLHWRFKPGRIGSKSVPVLMRVPIIFQLQ